MIIVSRWTTVIRKTLIPILAAAGLVGFAEPASAYLLFKSTSCSPGQKWDVSRPVQVRVLGDSVFDYFRVRGNSASLIDLDRINRDIQAVIGLYNAIPGSRLKLELGPPITNDNDLDSPSIDNFGAQTIVIGFTNGQAPTSISAEAFTSGDPKDGCTITREHIQIRKSFYWIFGPPDTTDVEGRSFATIDQPLPKFSAPAVTFLGILTHEMGHAVGLDHPDSNYAVMAQNFRTWFRGNDDVLHTRLLPDDTAGVLALYGMSSFTPPLDISVSNSWFKPAVAQISGSCATQIDKVNAAAKAVSDATGLPITAQFPAGGIFKGEYAD